MAHVLARMKGVQAGAIREQLKADAAEHAKRGLYVEHVWSNAEEPADVLFLFRCDDLDRARQFIQQTHSEARKQNPDAKLPQMTFLEEA